MKLAEATAIANASRDLLLSGDAEGAERVLAPVLKQLRTEGAALHLMGLIKKAQNNFDEAERYLRSAIAQSLTEGAYYNDLGVVLQTQRKFGEAVRVFKAALALVPAASAIRANLVRCHLAAGELVDAEREALTFIQIEPGAESWSLLSQIQRAQDNNDAALDSAQKALAFSPNARGLRYGVAAALDRVGRGGEALEYYERLAKQDLDTPELALNYMRALYHAGRKQDAEQVGEQAIQLWPGAPLLHSTLARMRLLRGEGENCTALSEAELLWRRPTDLALRLACADVLHRGGYPQKALTLLEEAVRFAPDSAPLLTALGVVLDELHRSSDALSALRRAADLSPGSRSAQRNLLSSLLRVGLPTEALQITRRLRADEPDEQYLLACEATALRLLGDPAYEKMCDFDRLVRMYDLPAPSGHFTMESFNAALSEHLRQQHRINAHPLDQPNPGMSQTGRNLLNAPDAIIKTLMAAADVAVRDYLTRLNPEAGDPVVRRRGKHYRYANLWSVRLSRGGVQAAHVHDRGWLSAVYIASLMPEERPREPTNGWLKIGEPALPPAKCGPERMAAPKVGQLVLLPSYMWHGVVAFEGAERLSAEFIVAPG